MTRLLAWLRDLCLVLLVAPLLLFGFVLILVSPDAADRFNKWLSNKMTDWGFE